MRTNLNPNIWGNKGWFFLDSIALSYPSNPTNNDKNNFKSFYTLVGDMLPCEKCRINYKKHLKNLPLTDDILSSRDNFFEWWVKIHNESRESMGKCKFTPEEVAEYYHYTYVHNHFSLKNILIILSLIILCIYVCKKYYK